MHDGIDLAAAAGAPIVAAADGRITSAGWHGGYGRAVSITHENGIKTTYGHMSRIAAYPGELVHRGQVIGYVGSSGLSTGPHLHFEVTRNGRAINPLSVKMSAGPGHMEGTKLRAFQDELRAVLLVVPRTPRRLTRGAANVPNLQADTRERAIWRECGRPHNDIVNCAKLPCCDRPAAPRANTIVPL
jgi:murein DD-endopeptidase MepM/ murein hydrolase activator NlpD